MYTAMGYRLAFLYEDAFQSLKILFIIANSAFCDISSASTLCTIVPIQEVLVVYKCPCITEFIKHVAKK